MHAINIMSHTMIRCIASGSGTLYVWHSPLLQTVSVGRSHVLQRGLFMELVGADQECPANKECSRETISKPNWNADREP